MKEIFVNEEDRVGQFIKYFKDTYINRKAFHPIFWLHGDSKQDIYYDATNNTAESLNHILKMKALLPFNLSQSLNTLVLSLKSYEKLCKSFNRNHIYEYSVERAKKGKEEYLEEISKNREILSKTFPNLKRYNNSF